MEKSNFPAFVFNVPSDSISFKMDNFTSIVLTIAYSDCIWPCVSFGKAKSGKSPGIHIRNCVRTLLICRPNLTTVSPVNHRSNQERTGGEEEDGLLPPSVPSMEGDMYTPTAHDVEIRPDIDGDLPVAYRHLNGLSHKEAAADPVGLISDKDDRSRYPPDSLNHHRKESTICWPPRPTPRSALWRPIRAKLFYRSILKCVVVTGSSHSPLRVTRLHSE